MRVRSRSSNSPTLRDNRAARTLKPASPSCQPAEPLLGLGGSSFCVCGPRLAYLLPSIDTRQDAAACRKEDYDPYRQTQEVNAAAQCRWGHVPSLARLAFRMYGATASSTTAPSSCSSPMASDESGFTGAAAGSMTVAGRHLRA